jgi:hypothetical protein
VAVFRNLARCAVLKGQAGRIRGDQKGDAVTDPYEIRLDDDGTIDEIVVRQASVHIERMDTNDFAITLDLPDGSQLLCSESYAGP